MIKSIMHHNLLLNLTHDYPDNLLFVLWFLRAKAATAFSTS